MNYIVLSLSSLSNGQETLSSACADIQFTGSLLSVRISVKCEYQFEAIKPQPRLSSNEFSPDFDSKV